MNCMLCGKDSKDIVCDSCLESLITGNNLYFNLKKVKVCVVCRKMLYNNKWKSPSSAMFESLLKSSLALRSLSANSLSDLLSFLKNHLKVNSFSFEDSFFLVNFTIKGVSSSVEVPVEKTICPSCSISKSKFYAGVLQVRGIPKGEIKFIDDVVDSNVKNTLSFITKREEVKGGVDYYITTMKALRRCAESLKSKFGAEVSFNETLFTRDSLRSKDIYKVNVLVRISKFRVGEVIEKGEEVFLIKSTAGTGINLKTGKHTRVKSYAGWKKVKVYSAVLLNLSPVSIMDPLTFQSVEAKNSVGVKLSKNNKVNVAFHNKEWFIVGVENEH